MTGTDALDAPAGRLVGIGQAARLLGVSPATVRRWTQIGFLPCRRTAGGHRRIARADVDELARAIGDSNQLAVRRARERELEALGEASIAVVSRLDQRAALAEIARQMTRLCRCHTCVISDYDREGLTTLAEYDATGRRTSLSGRFEVRDYPVTRSVLEEQTIALVNADDPRADPAELALLRRFGDRSTLMLPLVFERRTIGLLEALDRERSRAYSPQELRLCRALAGHAAVALHNARLYARANQADAAMAALSARLRGAASGLAALGRSPRFGAPSGFAPALVAELIRDVFAAASVVLTLDGAVVAAAAAPAGGAARPLDNAAAAVATRSFDAPAGPLAVTVSTTDALGTGDLELLDLLLSLAAVGREPLS